MNVRLIGVLISLGLFSMVIQLLAFVQPSYAQAPETKPIGKVLNLTGSVTVEHSSAMVVQAGLPAGGRQVAKVDDPVYQGDLIETGADASLGLAFADGTSFKLSSNAKMELNEFVYDPKSTSNSTLFSLEKGAFSFLAGNVAHSGSMKIDTPVATMGIRGTAPRVEIMDNGSVRFSTMIEENKNSGLGPRRAAPVRRTDNASATKKSVVLKDPDPSLDKDMTGRLKICRGC